MVKPETDAGSITSETASNVGQSKIHKNNEHPDDPEYVVKSIQSDALIIDVKNYMEETKTNFNKKATNITISEHQKIYKNITGCLKEIYVNVHMMDKKITIKNLLDENDRNDLKKQIEIMKDINSIFYNLKNVYKKKTKKKKN